MSWWPQSCEKVKDMGGISKGEAIYFEAFWEAAKSTESWKELGTGAQVGPARGATRADCGLPSGSGLKKTGVQEAPAMFSQHAQPSGTFLHL